MNPQKILIIRLSSIGDILLATPLIRILKNTFPNAEIDFVIKKQFIDLVRSNPHLHTIRTLDTLLGRKELRKLSGKLAKGGYDVVLDIHNNFRSNQLRKIPNSKLGVLKKYKWQRFLLVKFKWNLYKNIHPVYKRYIDAGNFLEIQDDEKGLEFHIDPLERKGVGKYLTALSFNSELKTIGIAPGAGFPTKQYPTEKTIAVLKNLAKDGGHQFILFGNKAERKITDTIQQQLEAPVINLAGEMTLMQTACAIDLCDIMITNDSGLMHLANALQKKTVSIFGCTVRELGFYPPGKNAVIVENKDLHCRPCSHMGRKRCPKKHFKCMLEITPERIYKTVIEQLARDV